ncbi:MAG TPA: putative bacteriocin export ABC transporter [Clostridiales bacterium]|nr:putative bacteriocin export ABC transporter [Clostridiales bacterium]
MSIISLNDICKKFDENIIFDNFNLEIEQGEFVSIMGKSGKGKTTLLNIIGLLEKSDSGDLKILDVKNPTFQSAKGIKLLRYHISYLFQNYGLVESGTVKYNLKMATHYLKYNKTEEEQKIDEALETVGLSGFKNKKVYKLSGGEQQRVAIAKVMLKPSEIILADEPTGSLDADNRDIILKLLIDLNKRGRTIIVVTHDPQVEKCASRQIKL